MIFRRIIFMLFVVNFLLANNLYSQDFIKVDSIVDTYPRDIHVSDKLAGLINKDFTRQDERARAIFRWIATNIAYNEELGKSMNYTSKNAFSYTTEKEKEIKEKKFKSDLVISTMIKKSTVCHGYAALYEHLCSQLGLESKIVVGNLKSDPSQIGKLPSEVNHAWNVVKIDGNWKFVDATLAAGFMSGKTNSFKFHYNDGYFFTSPERFFLNHYPSDEKWLLISKTKNDFSKLPLFFGSYLDSTYQITKPEFGLYSSLKNTNFIIEIKGLGEYDDVEYSFGNERKLLNREINSNDFIIPLNSKSQGYLTLYINGKILAVYKVNNI